MENEVIVITGSSNRFAEEIETLANEMKADGKTVIIDSVFHGLTESRGRKQFMRMILDADRLIVYNKDNYIGFHTCLEIATAIEAGIRIQYYYHSPPKFLRNLEAMYDNYKYQFFDVGKPI